MRLRSYVPELLCSSVPSQGGKLFALQRHLGHESLEMVRVYAHFTDQDAEDEKRKYSPADDIDIERHKGTRRGVRKE